MVQGESPQRHSIRLWCPAVPKHVLQAVCTTNPDIGILEGGGLTGFSDVGEEQIAADLSFWLEHPNIPAENVCSRLSNYKPRHESQERLIQAARYLAQDGMEERAIGLIAHGGPGLGKTHVSVGLAKEISSITGGTVHYFNLATQKNYPHTEDEYRAIADEGRGTIILDDVNNAYGYSGDALRAAVSAVHDVGGRLFITSNALDINAFLNIALKPSTSTGEAELLRLIDRVRNMLLALPLSGESYRSNTSINPWLGFMATDSMTKSDS